MIPSGVTMQVPADGQFGPLVRLAATQLAVLHDSPYTVIEDIRIAVGETIRVLLGSGDAQRAGSSEAPSRKLDVNFIETGSCLQIKIRCAPPVGLSNPLEASARILDATTSSYRFETETGSATLSFDLRADP